MKAISHRELRNHSGEVLRAVAAGESYTITNHGIPIARLIPMDEPTTDLKCVRRATKRGFSALKRYPIKGAVGTSWTTCEASGLRSLDALHLAGAIRLNVDVLVAYDARLRESATGIGLPVLVAQLKGRPIPKAIARWPT